MANLPVDSMRHGGLWWFTDLTVPDPYYLLPIATAASLGLILKMGVDGPKLDSMGALKYIIQAIPFIILPFTVNFPGVSLKLILIILLFIINYSLINLSRLLFGTGHQQIYFLWYKLVYLKYQEYVISLKYLHKLIIHRLH